jgi:hypothetical protein
MRQNAAFVPSKRKLKVDVGTNLSLKMRNTSITLSIMNQIQFKFKYNAIHNARCKYMLRYAALSLSN